MAYATMEVKAQSGKLVFAGRVLDEETQEPIPYAAVQIYAMPDSTFITEEQPEKTGVFLLLLLFVGRERYPFTCPISVMQPLIVYLIIRIGNWVIFVWLPMVSC